MFNNSIKVVYNSSNLIPFLIAVGFVKIFLEKDILLGSVAIFASGLLFLAQCVILHIARKQAVERKINILSISQDKDYTTIAIYFTYGLPIAQAWFSNAITLGRIDANSDVVLVIIGILVIVFSNRTIFNPVLKLLRYKFYAIETEHGVNITLITKKELRNKKNVNRVIRLFENCVMEI